MDVKVVFDYKVVLAIGVSVIGVILVNKLDPISAKEVSIQAIDAAKEYADASKSIRKLV